jgi:hypothetical protein
MADYVLLAGAKKNVGDFLIGARGRELLAHYRPDRTTVTWERWAPVDGRLDEVNASRALILFGGPAYAADFYPGVYRLARPLEKIAVPVIPLALGWSGIPDPDPARFRFTRESRAALRWIHSRIPASSCRDVVTLEVLRREGTRNVVMTGCTVWHHLASRGRPFRTPREVKRVAVTAAADRRWYRQNVELLEAVRACFPSAALHCVFHRGIGWDEHTSPLDALFHLRLARRARRLGYEVVDAAYDVARIRFYDECDLHVGYRVHAHLYFLSLRRPSWLIQEDGRGVGASRSLGTGDVAAWEPGAVRRLMGGVERALADGFAAFAPVAVLLDEAHAAMQEFLAGLP